MNNFLLPNNERARLAIIFLGISLVLSLAMIAVNLYLGVDGRLRTTDDLLKLSSNLFTLVMVCSLFLGVAQVLTVVFFILWFRRAYHNLHKAGMRGLLHSEGWAAGSWFVPVLFWIWPYQIMQDIYYGTPIVCRDETYEDERRASPLLPAWWALWLISMFSGFVSSALLKRDETMSLYVSCGGALLQVIAGVLLIQIIRNVSRMETDLFRRWQQQMQEQYAYQQQFTQH